MKGASYFRQNAREALKGKWGLAVITGIIASILGAATHGSGAGVNFNFNISGINNPEIETNVGIPGLGGAESFEEIYSGIDPAFWAIMGTAIAIGLVIGLVVGIAVFILGSIVSVGYAKFNLNLVDGADAEVNDLFKYFKHWKNTILANLLRSVYIFLWSLLCFIPGIIASYSYAMVPYIIADNPELTPTEACAKSKEMMNGYKFDLFTLYLSFIGWSLLCAFTCGIGNVVLTPYMEASVADFYREISGTRPIPESDETVSVYIPDSQF